MESDLQTKVTYALNENRTLILGTQVLLGFSYEAFFEKGFHQIPAYDVKVQIVNLLLILISTVLLIAPTCFHRVLGADYQTQHLLSFTSSMVEWALYPLALALGCSIFGSALGLTGIFASVILGTATFVIALVFWFIGPQIVRKKPQERGGTSMKYSTPINTRLQHVLTESRVLLPGAQALLGFQLITFYMDDYMRMDRPLQLVHLGSLLLISLAVILLIAPSAFHRIADRGEVTERSYRFASLMVALSAIPLGLGLIGELFLVMAKVGDILLAEIGSALALIACFGLWFGYALFVRHQSRGSKPK